MRMQISILTRQYNGSKATEILLVNSHAEENLRPLISFRTQKQIAVGEPLYAQYVTRDGSSPRLALVTAGTRAQLDHFQIYGGEKCSQHK